MGTHILPPLYEIVLAAGEEKGMEPDLTNKGSLVWKGKPYNCLAPSANLVYIGAAYAMQALQWLDASGNYYIYRGVFRINTAKIPKEVTVTAGQLRWWCDGKTEDTRSFTLHMVKGDFDIPIVASNYGDLGDETTPYGTMLSSNITIDAWNIMPLTAAGLAAINKGGWTQFAWRINHDIDCSPPPGQGINGCRCAMSADQMYLDLEYS